MKVSLSNRINGRVLAIVCKLVSATARFNIIGLENMEAIRDSGKPVLWTSWHGQSMLMACFAQILKLNPNPMVMIPDDWRGESLYHFLNLVNLDPHPMNLEDKGFDTARKFAALVRTLKKEKGYNCLFPDGPAGRSYEPKPGIIYLAQKTGAPLLPVSAYVRQAYEIKRWDAYVIPYPFSHIEVVVGKPLYLPQDVDRDSLKERVINAIHQVTMEAKANYYAAQGAAH
ncbi:MAG: hypothetical protein KDE51_16020 [Anaerolineales bacterium]|nr:hypothetical protein [Anaerolineales bacterium]